MNLLNISTRVVYLLNKLKIGVNNWFKEEFVLLFTKMNDKKNRIIFGLVGVLLVLGLVFYLSSSVIPKVLVTMSKATGDQKISIKNSFLLGSQMAASADGKDKCVVNVFVLNSDGKGIAGKQVQLHGLKDQSAMTDASGKATFEMTSTEAKQYALTASVNGSTLKNTVTVTFR